VSASHVHLIRHGEVDNPHQVVYADLPGYALSAAGHAQAAATGAHLASSPVRRVLTSPLLRARQTAAAIAEPHGLTVEPVEGLTEWTASARWAGVRWDDVDTVFPGELTAYLEHPTNLAFADETLADCGARVVAVARDAVASVAEGQIVIVGHQDPIHAAHIALTGQMPAPYHSTKPNHGAVITLEPRPGPWHRTASWEPEQGSRFPSFE
jgi:broad specificity phosphatase PhoE